MMGDSLDTFMIKSRNGGVMVGYNTSVKVNCNVGANDYPLYIKEIEKLNTIQSSSIWPDMFMDLSLYQGATPLYKEIMNRFGGPVGVVPSYLLDKYKINKDSAKDILKRLADDGISFFTLHLTANLSLLNIAKYRKIAVTSRGGAILLSLMRQMRQERNIWIEILPTIIDIVKSYDIVISIGATFRPASVIDACDIVHLEETKRQIEICTMLQREGIKTIVENVGHIDIGKISKLSKYLLQCHAPIMPLGPITTDCGIGMDQITAAIGASHMGALNCAHIINCVTSSEHTNPYFTTKETLDAIKTARLCAHIINISKGYDLSNDYNIYKERAKLSSCCLNNTCKRCSEYCPLTLI